MKLTEDQINRWANPPSETEDQKCLNAISQITKVLRDYFGSDISFIRQGSHTNRTNIRLDSDVDIAVVHDGHYFPDINSLSESDKQLYRANSIDSTYSYSQFKNDVQSVLKNTFGDANIERKNKCIRVLGNSYRINADVVPAYRHKRFSSYNSISAEGIGFKKDDSGVVYSFPKQHYDNGVKKNNNTSRSYKSVVRILKNLRNRFVENNELKLESMPSFFIESLAWNVPDGMFNARSWRETAGDVALKIWSDMRNPIIANNYAEVSDLMWLFRGSPARTHKQAEDFILKAWYHLTT
jgi:hypothetical protein